MPSWIHCRPTGGALQSDEEPIERPGRDPSALEVMLRRPMLTRAPILLSGRRHLRIPAMACLITAVSALFAGLAFAASPGQKVADYIDSHTTVAERHSFEGVELGDARAHGLEVLTRLPSTTAGWISARDFCIAADQALAVQPQFAKTIGAVLVLGRRVPADATGSVGGRRILAYRTLSRGHPYCARDGRRWSTG